MKTDEFEKQADSWLMRQRNKKNTAARIVAFFLIAVICGAGICLMANEAVGQVLIGVS